MQDISSITFVIPEASTKKGNSRNSALHELYELYISQPDENRKENRKRYHQWVRIHHPEVCKKAGFSKVAYDSFKPEFKTAKLPKEQKFLSYAKEDSFAWWGKFSHCSEDDIRYMISRARDYYNRGFNVAMYIMGATKFSPDKELADK